VDDLEAGIHVRITIMLRNIRNRVDFEDLKLFLDATSQSHYDFSYLRIDFRNNLKVVETFRKSTHTPKTTYSQNNFTCVFVSTIFPFNLPSSYDQVTDCLFQDTMSRLRARHLRRLLEGKAWDEYGVLKSTSTKKR
jgi:hypothetical protein